MKVLLLLHCCLTLFLTAQTAGKKPSYTPAQQMLLGSWNGSTLIAKNPVTKTWQITRKADGSFSKFEMWAVRGRMQKIKRNGKWWIKNRVYYEKDYSIGVLQTKNYKMMKDREIRFTSKNDGSVSVETKVK